MTFALRMRTCSISIILYVGIKISLFRKHPPHEGQCALRNHHTILLYPSRSSRCTFLVSHLFDPINTETMAPLSSLLTVALATSASAFSVQSAIKPSVRTETKLYENFGFDFAEDQAENTPQIILGEANYKKWVNSVDPNNMLNRQVRYRQYENIFHKFKSKNASLCQGTFYFNCGETMSRLAVIPPKCGRIIAAVAALFPRILRSYATIHAGIHRTCLTHKKMINGVVIHWAENYLRAFSHIIVRNERGVTFLQICLERRIFDCTKVVFDVNSTAFLIGQNFLIRFVAY